MHGLLTRHWFQSKLQVIIIYHCGGTSIVKQWKTQEFKLFAFIAWKWFQKELMIHISHHKVELHSRGAIVSHEKGSIDGLPINWSLQISWDQELTGIPAPGSWFQSRPRQICNFGREFLHKISSVTEVRKTFRLKSASILI